jgi:hypothetical protein
MYRLSNGTILSFLDASLNAILRAGVRREWTAGPDDQCRGGRRAYPQSRPHTAVVHKTTLLCGTKPVSVE